MCKLLDQLVCNNLTDMYGTNNNIVKTSQGSKELRSL